MSCCKRSSGMAPNVMYQLELKYQQMRSSIFPGLTVMCLLGPTGDIVLPTTVEKSKQTELFSVIQSLKKASSQFGESLQQSECPILHIKGRSHIFSCYDLDSNLLALYSEMHSVDIERFDTTVADQKMDPLLSDLRLIVGKSVMSA
eukprot:GFYU01003352.1.p1 GENE.GFYU01003352.1~~GFYU01003352.1.p1  ORF type:complete len:146 (-),score=26.24 GFYU01003352.1:384-821(-)